MNFATLVPRPLTVPCCTAVMSADVSSQSVQCSGRASQRSVSPPLEAVSRGSLTVGGALHFNWMAAGQGLGQPPATDVIAAFLVSTPSTVSSDIVVPEGQQRVAVLSKHFSKASLSPFVFILDGTWPLKL